SVDVNFMYRLPLFPVKILDSHLIGSWYAQKIPVLDFHELAAGKLAALLARQQARDLFDCNNILQIEGLDFSLLRIVFAVYGGMNRKDWREVSIKNVQFDVKDLNSKLVPMLNREDAKRVSDSAGYGEQLVSECRDRLSAVLPFTNDEYSFLNNLLTEGRIVPELLTEDKVLQDRISLQPGLKWKAIHVKKHYKV
ncbi:nucleotidyl transferase AbiEii/AbiGii toxin family protein, partial [bacterium]|nr:nucleotidyl transferase AbiEii/AbiGii toxin family protein [bacterium]